MFTQLRNAAIISANSWKAFPLFVGGFIVRVSSLALLTLLITAMQASPLMAQPTLLSGNETTAPLFSSTLSKLSAPHALTSTLYTPRALSCSINTACADGSWSNEISAVVNVVRGGATCTGVLINNTREDQTPYILTAHHCGSPSTGQHVDWTFQFNYQSASCSDPAETPVPQTLTGATVVAAQGGGDDYVLLRLDDGIPASFNVDFAGWSIEATPALNGTLIGHPKGDIKKITYEDQAVLDAGDYWYAQFDRGTVEAASSGAPLFNHNHQVVGLVRSSVSIDHTACSGPGGDDNKAAILFPKLSKIWTAGPAGEQIVDFLDPDATGATTLGALAGTGSSTPPATPSSIWINEINADTKSGNGPEPDEFIEIVGPVGTNLTNYQLDVYSCAANAATLSSTHTIAPFTLPDDYNAFGLFVMGGATLDSNLRHQLFDGTGSSVLPDGSGLIVLKDASGNEIFDYQYGSSSACPDTRTTRSAGDATGEGSMGFASQTPTTETPGTNALTASPRSSNFDGGQILPVELSSFDAVLDGHAVLLNWTTASETNNAGFEIQMISKNEGWKELAFIDGHGTTETEKSYGFRIDDLAPGRHTFRLKQIDYDGTFDYSPEVEVIVELADRFMMEPAYPNPFNPQATMRFAVNRQQTVEVAMYDMLGRRVQVLWSGEAEAGRMQEVRIDGSGLPSGVYLVRVAGNGFMETQRVTLAK